MPRQPSCSCGECTRCVRRLKKRVYERDRYARKKTDPAFVEKKRAANRRTMEKWRREQGMRPALPVLTEEERAKRRQARWKVKRLPRPSRCSLCGKRRKVEAHHPDYALPNHVVWVCRPCHSKITWASWGSTSAASRPS